MKINKRQREIKKRLIKRYPSKAELADKVNITQAYYSKLLNDKVEVSEELLDKIEKVLL